MNEKTETAVFSAAGDDARIQGSGSAEDTPTGSPVRDQGKESNKADDSHGISWKRDIKSMDRKELEEFVREKGLPSFRAAQLFRWIHARRAAGYGEMSDLPVRLRQELEKEYPIVTALTVDQQISKTDGTRKFLFSMPDGSLVESVFMRYRFGNSVCISSQVGCRMGCSFCASTLRGLSRSLAPSEMLEQIYAICRETKEPVSHVVVMGMGEPLDNYDSLIRFIHLLTCEEGMHLSQRNLTVSTCGIVPNIYRLSEEGLHITLALSLHAATDAQRKKIMPVAKKYSISELMKACGAYYRKTGRQVTFEYSLISGVNDSGEDAAGLARLARPLKAHINLIPVNPVRERDYKRPDDAGVRAFKKELENHGVNVSIRRALGKDIEGACGQLRSRHLES